MPDLINHCKYCGKEFKLRDDYILHLSKIHDDADNNAEYISRVNHIHAWTRNDNVEECRCKAIRYKGKVYYRE